jgi:hypothetical protein
MKLQNGRVAECTHKIKNWMPSVMLDAWVCTQKVPLVCVQSFFLLILWFWKFGKSL